MTIPEKPDNPRDSSDEITDLMNLGTRFVKEQFVEFIRENVGQTPTARQLAAVTTGMVGSIVPAMYNIIHLAGGDDEGRVFVQAITEVISRRLESESGVESNVSIMIKDKEGG